MTWVCGCGVVIVGSRVQVLMGVRHCAERVYDTAGCQRVQVGMRRSAFHSLIILGRLCDFPS